MVINSQKLINIRVETESGEYIGKLKSFDIDVDTQSIKSYYVKPPVLRSGIFSDELLIHNAQVLDITNDKMVVVDNIVKYKEKLKSGSAAQIGAEA